MKTNPNDPISPVGSGDRCAGLNKREYFAAMAMQGLLANEMHLEWGTRRELSETAVDMADYLIAHLNREETSTSKQ